MDISSSILDDSITPLSYGMVGLVQLRFSFFSYVLQEDTHMWVLRMMMGTGEMRAGEHDRAVLLLSPVTGFHSFSIQFPPVSHMTRSMAERPPNRMV